MKEKLKAEDWATITKQLERDQTATGVSKEDMESKSWKKMINDKCKAYSEEKWFEKAQASVVLKHMENPREGGTGKSTRYAKRYRMAKLGDTVSITGAREPEVCKKCGDKCAPSVMTHIVLKCRHTRGVAEERGLEGRGKVSEEGRMREILNDERNQDAVGAIIEKWMQKEDMGS